jgi:hypothetical protein
MWQDFAKPFREFTVPEAMEPVALPGHTGHTSGREWSDQTFRTQPSPASGLTVVAEKVMWTDSAGRERGHTRR